MIARASEIAAFSEAVVAAGSVRMEFHALWLRWTAAAPRLVGYPSQAAVLDDVLRRLNEDGTIELPVRAWDRSTVPPLPRFVIVPSARRTHRTREWESFPWRAELGWVASLRYLSAAGFADLVAVNDWLSRTEATETPIVPVRYRSADIFTKEKRLDDLSRTTLFGPGRLTLEMLACTRMAPQLAAAVVGAGADILVVENSDTYWVAVDALRNSPGHTIGLVAWGSGKSFPAQVASLGGRCRRSRPRHRHRLVLGRLRPGWHGDRGRGAGSRFGGTSLNKAPGTGLPTGGELRRDITVPSDAGWRDGRVAVADRCGGGVADVTGRRPERYPGHAGYLAPCGARRLDRLLADTS